MINILAWVVVGSLVGSLARVVGRGGHLGVIGDALIGIVGAAIGGIVFALLLPAAFAIAAANPASWGVSLLAAATLLFLVRAMEVSTRSPTRR